MKNVLTVLLVLILFISCSDTELIENPNKCDCTEVGYVVLQGSLLKEQYRMPVSVDCSLNNTKILEANSRNYKLIIDCN